MATIWSDSYIQQLANDGEIDVVNKVNPLHFRYALAVTSGTATYDLAVFVKDIIQITWKGIVLEVFTAQDVENLDAKYRTNTGGVRGYLWNEDYNSIRFFPVPNETITGDADPNDPASGVYGSTINTKVIISGFRTPNITSASYSLPNYITQRTLKAYVCSRAFLIEGKGQNLTAAQYWERKYQILIQMFKSIKIKYYSSNDRFPPFNSRRIRLGRYGQFDPTATLGS